VLSVGTARNGVLAAPHVHEVLSSEVFHNDFPPTNVYCVRTWQADASKSVTRRPIRRDVARKNPSPYSGIESLVGREKEND
jgi:hypothetical protein